MWAERGIFEYWNVVACEVTTRLWNVNIVFNSPSREMVGSGEGFLSTYLHNVPDWSEQASLFSELFRNKKLDSVPLEQVPWSACHPPKGNLKNQRKFCTYLKEMYVLKNKRTVARNEANRDGTDGPEGQMVKSPATVFGSSIEWRWEGSRVGERKEGRKELARLLSMETRCTQPFHIGRHITSWSESFRVMSLAVTLNI